MRRRAAIVTVGTEIVEGLRLDTNTQEVATVLAEHGYQVLEAVSVADDVSLLAATVRRLAGASALVLVTGGLGPTHDDITRQAAADALDLALARNPEIEERLRPVLARHRSPHAAAKVFGQADVLTGARVIMPTTGTAPGQLVQASSGAWVALLPGPPAEMRPMLTEVLAALEELEPTAVDRAPWAAPRELGFVGLSESDAQLVAEQVLKEYPHLRLTLLAKPGDVRVVLFDDGARPTALESAAEKIATALEEHCYTTTGETLAEAVLSAARTRGLTLATAESCTGGMIAAALTDVPGASKVFRGSIVAYSNEVKVNGLGVSAATLASYGAVSEQSAVEMAEGARIRFDADVTVSVTGVAGPGGGTPDKPVGLVWFAVSGRNGTTTAHRMLPGDRAGIRLRATSTALDLLRRELLSR